MADVERCVATAIPPPAAPATGSARSCGNPTTCASIRAPAAAPPSWRASSAPAGQAGARDDCKSAPRSRPIPAKSSAAIAGRSADAQAAVRCWSPTAPATASRRRAPPTSRYAIFHERIERSLRASGRAHAPRADADARRGGRRCAHRCRRTHRALCRRRQHRRRAGERRAARATWCRTTAPPGMSRRAFASSPMTSAAIRWSSCIPMA